MNALPNAQTLSMVGPNGYVTTRGNQTISGIKTFTPKLVVGSAFSSSTKGIDCVGELNVNSATANAITSTNDTTIQSNSGNAYLIGYLNASLSSATTITNYVASVLVYSATSLVTTITNGTITLTATTLNLVSNTTFLLQHLGTAVMNITANNGAGINLTALSTAGSGGGIGMTAANNINLTGQSSGQGVTISSPFGWNSIAGAIGNNMSSNISSPLTPTTGQLILQAATSIYDYIGTTAKLIHTSVLTTISNAAITLTSSTGNTTITSTLGNNNITASAGANVLTGNTAGSGNSNTILANTGANTMYATLNNNYLTAAAGVNSISGNAGSGVTSNNIQCATGNNAIVSTAGTNAITAVTNTITGNAGTSNTSNSIVATTGNNLITSTSGNNTIKAPSTYAYNYISAEALGGNNSMIGNSGTGGYSNYIQAISGSNEFEGNGGAGNISNRFTALTGDNKLNATGAGSNNLLTAVNSNVISTTGTSSASSNQMIANGTATFPNAYNQLVASGYGGDNSILALNQSGFGYNTIQAWYSNTLSTASTNGTNYITTTGASSSNYINCSGTNSSNILLSSGTGGVNTFSSSLNTINGASTFANYSGVASAVTIQNSNGINVVNATTHATYQASSVSLMSLVSVTTFLTPPTNTTYVTGSNDYTSFTGSTNSGIAFPVNVIPIGYNVYWDSGTFSGTTPSLQIQVITAGSVVLATSSAITLVSGSSGNSNGKFTSPVSTTAGTGLITQINVTTFPTTQLKKFKVNVYFAQW